MTTPILASLLYLFSSQKVIAQHACSAASISCHNLPGIKVLDVKAEEFQDYSSITLQDGDIPTANWTGLNFCAVNVTYTHPGKDDRIIVQTWLPLENEWNGRFQGTGGGGWLAGLGPQALIPAIADGYAASSTDAGVRAPDASGWALLEPGKVDFTNLENFASIALNDMASIGKAVTRSYYGKAPKYSYWSGCSQGGRQGMMMAQRYPEAFDGILALAPAFNWGHFIPTEYWPQQTMNVLDYYPEPCELEFLTEAGTKACDGLDGLEDGVISLPVLCDFDPRTLIGERNNCKGDQNTVTWQAAAIAAAAWNGPSSASGEHLWYGVGRDAPLTGEPGITIAETECNTTDRSSCTGVPFIVSSQWFQLFIEKDPKFDDTSMSNAHYRKDFHRGIEEFDSIIGTADPNLSSFRKAGGKLLSWHGIADQLIMPNGTAEYYDRVKSLDPDVEDFYRFFLAPGTTHCTTGAGPYPYKSLDTLVKWVEEGQAPDTLPAYNRTANGDVGERLLCLYPKVQTYVGGDPDKPESFECV